jgi:hypothetical protein
LTVNPNLPFAGQVLFYALVLMIAMALITALTFSDPAEIGLSAFPKQLFLLPASSQTLALTPMIFGSAIMIVLGAGFCFEVLVPKIGLEHAWSPIPYLAGSLVFFQAMCWSSFPHPLLRILGGLLPISVMLAAPLLLIEQLVEPWQIGVAYGALFPVSFLMAVRGVSRARTSEASQPWEPRVRIPAKTRFRTPVGAQIWLEVKRNGLITTCMNLLIVTLFTGIAVFAVPQGPGISIAGTTVSQPAVLVAPVIVYISLLITSFCGTCASQSDNLTKTYELQPFLALRPLSTAQLIEAKMKMAAVILLRCSAISVCGALLVLLIPSAANPENRPTLFVLLHMITWKQGALALLGYVAALVAAYKGMISGIWLSIGWLHPVVKLLLSLIPIWICLIAIGGPTYLYSHQDEIPRVIAAIPYVLGSLVAVKFLLTAVATAKLRAAALVRDDLILKWGAVWLVVGVLLSCGLLQVHSMVGVSLAAIAASQFLSLPFARVALTPILVSLNRHR